MIKIFNTIFQRYVYVLALVAIVSTIHTAYDFDQCGASDVQERQIQSFTIRTLDNSIFLQSSDVEYCRFLEMYSSSFTVSSAVNETEMILDKHTALLEYIHTNGENYSVYIQLSEPLDNTKSNKFVELLESVSPSVTTIDSEKNIYLYKNSFSDELKELLSELENS